MTVRRGVLLLLGLAGLFLWPEAARAQSVTLDLGFGDGGGTTGRIIQLLALITIVSLAPSILVMMTSFTRIVVVLSLLRSALGVQQAPPNAVIVSLALFLTAFIMMPTLERVYDQAITPLVEESITEGDAMERAAAPIREFMLEQVRERDLALFLELTDKGDDPAAQDLQESQESEVPALIAPEATPLSALIPAFMISELRRAFEIGFLMFLPFIIIDMAVAAVLMSMGMIMLPPIMISLPFKLIFFVLVDGWYLVAGSLIKSYGG